MLAALQGKHVARLMQAFNLWHSRGGHDPADQAHLDAVRMLSAWQELVEHCLAHSARLEFSAAEFCERPELPSTAVCGPRLLDVVEGWNFSRGDPTYACLSRLAAQYRQRLAALSDAVRSMSVEELRRLLKAWDFAREGDSRFADAQQDVERWTSQYRDLCRRLDQAVDAQDLPLVQALFNSWNFDRDNDENVRRPVAFVNLFHELRRELEQAVADGDVIGIRKILKRWVYGGEDDVYRTAVAFNEQWGKHYEDSMRADLAEAVASRHMAIARKCLEDWTFVEDELHHSGVRFEEECGPEYDRLCQRLDAAVTGGGSKLRRQRVIHEVLAAWTFSREDEIYIEARNLLSGLLLLHWLQQPLQGTIGAGLRVVCLLDQSTSIGDHAFYHDVKPAVKVLVQQLQRLDEVARCCTKVLWRFAVFPGRAGSDGHQEDCQDICGAWMPLDDALGRLGAFEYEGGSTPMHAALDAAREMLQEPSELGPAKELVIVFTDGEPNDRDLAVAASSKLRARGRSLLLHGVGIGKGIRMHNLEQITCQQCTRMELDGLQDALAQWLARARRVASEAP